jgi:hypothetical protein
MAVLGRNVYNMATMTGVVLPGDRRLELREFPMPEPGYGQVLVRMKASSLNDPANIKSVVVPK